MRNLSPVFLALSLTCLSGVPGAGGPAHGAEVTVREHQGGLSITGDLLSFENGFYVIRSKTLGVMSLEAVKFACDGPACPRTRASTFGVHGSNTIGAQLMPALINGYSAAINATAEQRVGADPEEIQFSIRDQQGRELALIDVRSHGTNSAALSLANGKAEIGMFSRPMTADEAKGLAKAGLAPAAHVLALDGLLVLVSPRNPARSLTLDQIAQVFAGTIRDWSQLGQPAGKINIYARDEKSGTFDTFDSLVLKPRNLRLSAEATRFESTADLSDAVARDPQGIGFAAFAYLRNAKALAIAGSCGIVSTPSVFNVKTEDYPLARRLFLYTAGAYATAGVLTAENSSSPLKDFAAPRSGLARELLDHALSDAAQGAVAETGFVDLGVDSLPFNEQRDRLAGAFDMPAAELTPAVISHIKQMAEDLRTAMRLSISFRFERGADQLDAKGRQDIARLARYLARPGMENRQVILAGFSDPVGPFDINQRLSQNRATAVRNALVAAGGPALAASRILPKGYSKLMPVACADGAADNEKNRRVEVWMQP